AIHTGKEAKSETKSEIKSVTETGSLGRFKPKTEEEVKHIEDKNHAAKTKKNTQLGLKIFQDWHLSVHGDIVDLATVDEERLYNLLRKFYCEEKKSKSAELQLKVYHKNTMKNIRAALNRHLRDIGSNKVIVHGQLFKSANRTLNGLLKTQMRQGLSQPTKHKSIISNSDLSILANYISLDFTFNTCMQSGITLRFICQQGLGVPSTTKAGLV
ncbi:hypothetical protein MAR_029698, partial [Mya arenaria]